MSAYKSPYHTMYSAQDTLNLKPSQDGVVQYSKAVLEAFDCSSIISPEQALEKLKNRTTAVKDLVEIRGVCITFPSAALAGHPDCEFNFPSNVARIVSPDTAALSLPIEFPEYFQNIGRRVTLDDRPGDHLAPSILEWRFYVKRLMVWPEVAKSPKSLRSEFVWKVKTADLLSSVGMTRVSDLSSLA